MPVPDFQAIMLPLLQFVYDGAQHSLSDAIEVLGQQFRLTPEEMREPLPSGRQARFTNRVGWAKTYLAKTGLLQTTRRGMFCITERGLSVLNSRPERIDIRFLSQFPELSKFRSITTVADPDEETEHSTQDPVELIANTYRTLRQELAGSLLEQIKQNSPRFFEQLVIDLLVAMGYGGSWEDASRAVGRSGDDGIDGVIKEDRLGLDIIYVQAKRWESTVGRPIIQAFAGSLEGQRARKGIFITTSDFSQQAIDYVQRIEKKIVLIDGQQLAELMIDHNIGVAVTTRYEIKRVDSDYFTEG